VFTTRYGLIPYVKQVNIVFMKCLASCVSHDQTDINYIINMHYDIVKPYT